MFYASKRNYSFDYFTSLTIFFLSFKQTVASSTVLDYLWGTLNTLKDPRLCDDNPSKIWSLFPSHMIESLKNLELIDFYGCHSLEVIFELEESHVALVDQLRKLELCQLDKLMHIWKKGPKKIMGFGNMRSLKVKECNSLTNLFSPSIAKLLVMLWDIEVFNCGKIEEILASAGEEEDEKDVLLSQVFSILLEDLPNLKWFCPEANAFEWLLLQIMKVTRCPTLRTFVPTNLKTPQLEEVIEGNGYRTHWKGDLNATIEHILKKILLMKRVKQRELHTSPFFYLTN